MKRTLRMASSFVALALCSPLALQAQSGLAADRTAGEEIARVEEQFRAAKLAKDTSALARVLHEQFMETNQNGNSRDKTAFIDLFKYFPIQSLTTDQSKVQVAGNVAVVTGAQTETGTCAGKESMLFTRVYVREDSGWRLISSAQFRNPLLERTAAVFMLRRFFRSSPRSTVAR
jgi:ketosteroid isomerase-like protein